MRQPYLNFIVAVSFALSCGPSAPAPPSTETAAEVAEAMERYQGHFRALAFDSLASMFAEDGMLLEPGIPPIQGRETIRAFLLSFPGVEVHEAVATPDTIEVLGTDALLWGSFFERLTFPGQPLSEQHGKLLAQWRRHANGAWEIRRLWRIPVPSPVPSDSPSPS